MERIVLRHLSGSKTNQVEEFPLNHINELVLGRDPSSTVKYDPDRDDLVGRQHAKIAQDPADTTQFTVTDLNSRNGTFLNKQRIVGTSRIGPGDVVQLGPGGPEFQFDLEPRPASAVKATRMAASTSAVTLNSSTLPSIPQTRTVTAGASTSPAGSGVGAPKTSVGKATVERMISQNINETKRREGRKYLVIGGAAVLTVLVLFGAVAAFLMWQHRKVEERSRQEISDLGADIAAKEAGKALAPAEIVKASGKAIVKIEVAWRLISPNGGLVYHQYVPNLKPNGAPFVPGGPPVIALYVQTRDGSIEPYLTYDGNKYSVAIGGEHTGSGFVVSSDGFILTNRHVAATWKTRYEFPESANFGIVFAPNKRDIIGTISHAPSGNRGWVPAQTKQEISNFQGRNDKLDVVFPNTDGRIAAQLVRSSDRHDVAMIKINIPDAAPKVEINDNYDGIQPGEAAIVLGYPAVSPPVFGIIKSRDVFNPSAQYPEIPDPTVSVGHIGRVLRSREASGNQDEMVSYIGDVYQLTINSTGAGNSGGPVFDDHGRVTGIFFAGLRGDAAITFAVPIRYGKELMSVGGGPK